MTRTMRARLAALAVLALAAGGARSQPVEASAVVLRAAHVCVACHGESGRSATAAIPSIAGQTRPYLIAQLKDFRSQVRAEPGKQGYMWGISALLDDTTIDGLATHFAAQAPAKGRVGDAEQARAGAAIFREGLPDRGVRACAGCHGVRGEGAERYPRLAGQNAEYVRMQLDDFDTALRPHAGDMRAEVRAMTPAERRAVAEYLQSL